MFIHGWPLSHKQFEYQFDVLPAMGYRCIGIDWRGFGNSDKPISGYTYDRLADDIRTVFVALQLDNFTLVGHSTGGAIAIRYMARYNGYGVSKLDPQGWVSTVTYMVLGGTIVSLTSIYTSIIPVESVPPRLSATAGALIMSVGELIGAFVIGLAGSLADMYGLPVIMIIAAAAHLIAAMMGLCLKETNKRKVKITVPNEAVES